MLRRDFMPRPHNAALKQRERRFHSVCVNVAVRVFPRVIDSLVKVLLHLVERPWVDSGFVRHDDLYMAPNVRIDNLAHRLRLCILSTDQPQISVALANANYNLLDALWPPTA